MIEFGYAVATVALQCIAWIALILLVAGVAIGIRETLAGTYPGDEEKL